MSLTSPSVSVVTNWPSQSTKQTQRQRARVTQRVGVSLLALSARSPLDLWRIALTRLWLRSVLLLLEPVQLVILVLVGLRSGLVRRRLLLVVGLRSLSSLKVVSLLIVVHFLFFFELFLDSKEKRKNETKMNDFLYLDLFLIPGTSGDYTTTVFFLKLTHFFRRDEVLVVTHRTHRVLSGVVALHFCSHYSNTTELGNWHVCGAIKTNRYRTPFA